MDMSGRPLTQRIFAVALGVVALVVVPTGSGRALAGPTEIAPPVISGAALVGNDLTGSPGTWAGAQPISYAFQWLRCKAEAADDSSTNSCSNINGATTASYAATSSDLGMRLRFRVKASNKQGTTQATSAATSVVTTEGGKPANSSPPTISGSALVASTLTAATGSWVGDQPITYSYSWLRCDKDGNACKPTGKSNKTYKVVKADAGKSLRVRVIAKNSRGQSDAFSYPTDAVVDATGGGAIQLPTGEKSVDAKDVPKDARLVVDEVRFSPSPATSRTQPIYVAIRVKDTRNNVVRNATVFIRSTPILTTGGDNGLTAIDGWISYTLQPRDDFPLKTGYNVQFFVKAYRKGDPSLGGIYGSRLVQLPTKTP
jgi:hypothetical protein